MLNSKNGNLEKKNLKQVQCIMTIKQTILFTSIDLQTRFC